MCSFYRKKSLLRLLYAIIYIHPDFRSNINKIFAVKSSTLFHKHYQVDHFWFTISKLKQYCRVEFEMNLYVNNVID